MSKWFALEPYEIIVYDNEAGLDILLDGLEDGEHVYATWVYNNEHTMTIEGPVNIDGGILQCDRPIRWEDGMINPYLTSLEVSRVEEMTATREDEKALNALVDSLKEGETVTAELRDESGTMGITGMVMVDGVYKVVVGDVRTPLRWLDGVLHHNLQAITVSRPLRWLDGVLHHNLQAITVSRPVVYRWERYDGK